MIHSQVQSNGICVIRPEGDRLTALGANAFRQEASQLIDDGSNRIIIDLSQVRFVDSSGLGAIVGLLKKVGNRGEVVVCGLSDAVRQMFRVTRMERVFQIFPDPAAASAALDG
ncbi:STAS domain-containing protein [Paracoccus benzoatiresistens]|uniref:Anti-sigma factor antagonist n=1 Tax=Paracoccus benzoatiresistens TaxID=2997341 RepID=A0ABT4J422_9RHOB|nr:STAS domain-containing protein [Paracoccus sp. EF6]MCZ0961855.1 STAS domain-containing protein [Paracoccus sp. EF6]